MRVLVTGGAGFVGSNYTRMILNNELSCELKNLTVLDKLTYAGNLSNLEPVFKDKRFQFIQGDICDAILVNALLADHDVIVHFAAESHVDRSIEGAQEFVNTNVLGTQTLLEASVQNKIKIFLHISTDEVYGSIDAGSWSEESILAPNSPYSASKAASDLMVRAYVKTYGLDARITRCSNNFGPYQFPEKLIPLFVTNLIDNLPLPIYGDGLNVREWIHVDDHCRAIQEVINNGKSGEIYNVGGGTELSNIDICKLIISLMEKDESLMRFVADRKGHDFRYSVNSSKILKEVGFKPAGDFEKRLEKTISWYISNEGWWRALRD